MATPCSCGWGGVDCTTPLVPSPLNVSCDAANGVCDLNSSFPSAVCSCNCGTWGGEECSTYSVLLWNSVICIVVGTFLVVWFTTWLAVRDCVREKKGRSEWDRVPGIAGFTPNSYLPQWRKPIVFFRGFFFVFAVYVQVDDIVTASGAEFQYFTVWSYCFLIFYFGLGIIVAYRGILREEKGRLDVNAPLDLLERAHFAAFHLILPDTLLVDVVLWGILYPDSISTNTTSSVLNFVSYMQHAANILFVVFDVVFCTQYALTAPNVFFFLDWLAIYGLFQFIFITAGGCPAYFFLDMSQPYTLPWLLAILVLATIFYYFLAGITWHCRCCLGKRYYTCDDENEEDMPENECLEVFECAKCQRCCCRRCGPPRYKPLLQKMENEASDPSSKLTKTIPTNEDKTSHAISLQ